MISQTLNLMELRHQSAKWYYLVENGHVYHRWHSYDITITKS